MEGKREEKSGGNRKVKGKRVVKEKELKDTRRKEDSGR